MSVSTSDFVGSTLKPGFALIEPAPPPEESELIYIPDGSKWAQCWGTVLQMRAGEFHPGFDAGDTVVFGRTYAAHFETSERDTLCLVRNEDVIGVIEGCRIRPVNRNVILKQGEIKSVTDGGIHIPTLENYQGEMSSDGILSGNMYVPKEPPNDYTVVASCEDSDIRPGSRVVCDECSKITLTVGAESYVCVGIDSVMAVIA